MRTTIMALLTIAIMLGTAAFTLGACDFPGGNNDCSKSNNDGCTCANINCATGTCNYATTSCTGQTCWAGWDGSGCRAAGACETYSIGANCVISYTSGKQSCTTCKYCTGSSASCQFVTGNTDPYAECSGVTSCSGENIIINAMCSGTGVCGYNANTCAGTCASACVDGYDTCQTPAAGTDPAGYCTASYDSCIGAGSPYTCQRTGPDGNCDGAGGCNTGGNTANIANGYVCTGSGTQRAASTTYYAFLADSGACSAPGSPTTGFGDRVMNVYGCNGANAQGASVGTITSDCTSGCCLDQGATTTCIGSGTTTSNFYDFGSGDGTANDYCVSATVKDCNAAAQCSSASFTCQYNNCIAASGRLIVQNNSGSNMTIFDQYGRIILRGALNQNTAGSPAAGSWQVQNTSGTAVAWVTPAGDFFLKGTASQSQSSVTPSGNNDFIIQNSSGATVTYIDGATGNLYTLSTITSSAITGS